VTAGAYTFPAGLLEYSAISAPASLVFRCGSCPVRRANRCAMDHRI